MTESTVCADYTSHRDGNKNAGVAIVFIHGMSAGAWCFRAMAKHFEDRGSCTYCIDLPGHGTRKGNRESMTLARYIRASRNLVTEVTKSHEKVYVVGHSMGGLITQVLGSKIAVAGIMLLAPSPTAGIQFDSFGWSDFAETLLSASKLTLKDGKGLLRNHIGQFFYDPKDPVIDVWANERVFDPISVAARIRYAPPKMNLPKTDCALVVIPKRDIVIKPLTQWTIAQSLAEAGPFTTAVEVPLSHMLVMEQGWEIVAETIGNWIDPS